MQTRKQFMKSAILASLPASGAFAMLIFALPAQAQDGERPSNADQHPGKIVFSRDVPYGTATRRFSQGEASTVAPDQTELIISTLVTGLQPLTDAEQAGVTAPLNRGLALARQATELGVSHLTNTGGSTDFTRSENGASSTGNIISRGLSVLPSALGVIARTSGNGQ